MKKIIIPFILLLMTKNMASAQKVDSIMSIYANTFTQEKMHLHFDKNLYRQGETIWYKVYLMADFQQSPFSKNFYADWYDNNGKLLAHTINPFYQSTTRGQFEIPVGYQGDKIHLKAYTRWMLNFDSAFIFEKDIKIQQSVTETSKKVTPTVKPTSSIHFFPEGGDWLAGIESRIAFLVNNQNGKPVDAVGAIVNAKGEFIDSFSTTHDGMGVISLTPNNNLPLNAIWRDVYGNKYNTPLPLPKTTGLELAVQPTKTKTLFVVQYIKSSAQTNVAHVIANMNQHIVYMSKVLLKNSYVAGEIPTADLPTGVLQVTLFDSAWKPVAERVVFVNNGAYSFTPNLNIVTKGTDKRERNVFEITVDDSIKSNMSISITDAGWYHDSSNNIISQLLLSSDIKGYINNPAYYFSSDADSVKQHLDLVMLTHGWRRYDWDAVVKGDLPKLKNEKDTDYLEIKGKIYGHAFSRRNAQNINLILMSKDSTSRQLVSLPINKDGSFLQKGVLFFDTVKAYYQFNGDKRLTDIATVKFSTGLISNFPKKIYVGNDYPLALPNFLKDTTDLSATKNITAQIERAERRLKAHELAEVTVTTKVRRHVDVLDEKYATGFFSGGDSYQFDLMNDKFAQSSPDVFWYLQGKVAGLQIDENGIYPTLKWRGASPELFLDEISVRADELRSIQVADIAYIKVFRPPFFGSFGSGEGGAIAIYTRKGEDVQYVEGRGMGYALLDGYTKYKEFYSPDYSYNQSVETDTRTTLYWNPYLLTNPESKTVKVEFYNNDFTQKFRVVIEGINAEGKLARVEKIIE